MLAWISAFLPFLFDMNQKKKLVPFASVRIINKASLLCLNTIWTLHPAHAHTSRQLVGCREYWVQLEGKLASLWTRDGPCSFFLFFVCFYVLWKEKIQRFFISLIVASVLSYPRERCLFFFHGNCLSFDHLLVSCFVFQEDKDSSCTNHLRTRRCTYEHTNTLRENKRRALWAISVHVVQLRWFIIHSLFFGSAEKRKMCMTFTIALTKSSMNKRKHP